MNAERLHVISLFILDDLKQTNAENALNSIVKSLQNQVNQPQEPSYQQQVSDNLKTLYDALDKAPSNEFSPTWRLTLEEIGGEGLLGDQLKSKVQSIFERNQITLLVALQELLELHSQLNKFRTALEQIVTGFSSLGIGKEDLEQGQCELGVLVPRTSIENKLKNFGNELNEIDKIFGVFAELATGSRPGLEIRSISSSELNVFLDILPEVAACSAIAVERIIALYKKLLEIRKLHKELQEQGVSKEDLKGVEDHANNLMKSGIDQLVEDLLNKYWKADDDGRRHELAIELRYSLDKIANRVDKGYNIEIRVEPLKEKEEEATEDTRTAEVREHIKIIQLSAKTLQFLKLEGEPILCLPESKDQDNKKS